MAILELLQMQIFISNYGTYDEQREEGTTRLHEDLENQII
jgi:hypothetical protein